MTDPQEKFAWLIPMVRKRPETAMVLHALLLVLRSNGEADAEDAHHIEVSNPNVRGAAMKLLRSCGCEPKRVTYSTTKKGAGHAMMVWHVTDTQLFHDTIQRITVAVSGIPERHEAQRMLI